MIDIHTHILYAIDDGAKDIFESEKMCAAAERNGINKIVLTPHIKDCLDFGSFFEMRKEKTETLKEALNKKDIAVELFTGAEVFLDDDIFYCNDLRRYTINNTDYMLCEFQDNFNSDYKFIKLINEIKNYEIIPIIAHVEFIRLFYDNIALLRDLKKDLGFKIQLNAGSLCKMGRGETNYITANKIIKEDLADFIATDAHNTRSRNNNILNMIEQFDLDIENSLLELLLETNPQKVLDGVMF